MSRISAVTAEREWLIASMQTRGGVHTPDLSSDATPRILGPSPQKLPRSLLLRLSTTDSVDGRQGDHDDISLTRNVTDAANLLNLEQTSIAAAEDEKFKPGNHSLVALPDECEAMALAESTGLPAIDVMSPWMRPPTPPTVTEAVAHSRDCQYAADSLLARLPVSPRWQEKAGYLCAHGGSGLCRSLVELYMHCNRGSRYSSWSASCLMAVVRSSPWSFRMHCARAGLLGTLVDDAIEYAWWDAAHVYSLHEPRSGPASTIVVPSPSSANPGDSSSPA